MARIREFDERHIFETAIDLFWKKGYNSVSTKDLIDAFGISRSSMYGAYKDKRNLFIIALQQYRESASKKIIKLLNRSDSVKETIFKILTQFVKETIADKDSKGCFIVNTAIELAPHDDEILKIILEHRNNIVTALTTAIERGMEKGEIKTDQNPKSLANFFYNLINGLRVDAKIHKDKDYYKQIVEIAIGVLEK